MFKHTSANLERVFDGGVYVIHHVTETFISHWWFFRAAGWYQFR